MNLDTKSYLQSHCQNKITMKYINLSILFIALFLTACQNEDSLITETVLPTPVAVSVVDMEIAGWVNEQRNISHWTLLNQNLHNVTVKLMFDGVAIDEVNTGERGQFAFDEQPVPVEGAYLLFESEGYFNNVVKVDTITGSKFSTNLIRQTFPEISSEAISEGGPYIKLKGILVNNFSDVPYYYITNSNNELIGTAQPYNDFTNFEITTLANESLFFHYVIDCFDIGTVELGAFSQDTDLGVLLDDSYNFEKQLAGEFFTTYDCDGNQLEDISIFFQRDGLTVHSWGNSGYADYQCNFELNPNMVVTVATQNPRKFAEIPITFVPDQDLITDIVICQDDDTYVNYTLGSGGTVDPDIFTYANILPDGRLLVKQKDKDYDYGTDISFEFADSNVGNNVLGNVIFYGAQGIQLGGTNLSTTITLNDGEYIEGTFTGAVFDPFESSLGNLSGSFRARLQ